jgi:DivIVA domain-containing protein
MWVFAIVVVLLIGAIAVVAMGRGDAMEPVFPDRPDSVVAAERMLTSRDLRHVQFAIGVRGYRMDEVDSLLDRLAEELAIREARDARKAREGREDRDAEETRDAADGRDAHETAADTSPPDAAASDRGRGASARESLD